MLKVFLLLCYCCCSCCFFLTINADAQTVHNIVKFQGREGKLGTGQDSGGVVLYALGSTSKQETQHNTQISYIISYLISYHIIFALYKVRKENCGLLPVLKTCKIIKVFIHFFGIFEFGKNLANGEPE